jgi:hypothetical protein
MRRSRNGFTILAAAALLAACSGSTGPDGNGIPGGTESFEWSGQVAAGGTVEIKGLAGDIRAVPTAGRTARVTALKRGTADDPSSVRIEVVEHPGGVTVCAVYPDVPGQPKNECQPGYLRGQVSSRNNDVSVTFDVQVPAGSNFTGVTIGGAVRAGGLDGDVFAATVGGNVYISTSGHAAASTIGGNITASIGITDLNRDLLFSSAGGNLTVRIPPNINARVSGSTGTGSISTDFPLAITRVGPARRMSGVLGNGGHDLVLATSGGDIALRSR